MKSAALPDAIKACLKSVTDGKVSVAQPQQQIH